jgi:hypothetical protein
MEIKSTDVRGYGKLLMIGTAMLLAGCNSVFVLSGNPLQPSSKLAITQATLEQEKLEMRIAVRLRQPAHFSLLLRRKQLAEWLGDRQFNWCDHRDSGAERDWNPNRLC